jgi:hypothetical protein
MKILVTGAGRGGTNLATELVRSLNIVNFTTDVEDRKLFEYDVIPNNYGTKLATENRGYNIENSNKLMSDNDDIFVVFVTRHPIDNCLSKIYRGRPKSKGGDSSVEEIASDGTKEGSVKSIKHMYSIYDFLYKNFNNRFIHIKMEDIIINKENEIVKICEYFNVGNTTNSSDFFKNNRNSYQKKRYGNSLDKNQIDLYKNLDDSFDGYFIDKKDYVDYMFSELNDIIKNLDY